MLPKIAIVGRPNVGKSSLFNRIIGTRLSITDDKPGVTRDRIYAKASWLGNEFYVIDTGGIELQDAPFQVEIKAQVEIALEEADVIIFLVDVRSQLTDDDNYIAKMLYKAKKEVLVAVNKVDDEKYKDNIYDFYSLGFGEIYPISTLHGIGLGDLLDAVISHLNYNEESIEEDNIKFSLIGRPNVGKSSLVNALLKENRVIVSDIAGTTRDSIDSSFTYQDDKYVIIDTAGMKKRGKIYENLEKYAQLRAIDAIIRSDIVLLVNYKILENVDNNVLTLNQDETITISLELLTRIIKDTRLEYLKYFSKYYQELTISNFVLEVINYMQEYDFIRKSEEFYKIYPMVTKLKGIIPKEDIEQLDLFGGDNDENN